ncbi:hypothetical protein F8S13_00720 [Chloroflexia bacterium SDU3-3]|nr:hypothetical protein F8S13_00720 [Chloroflexia bacterium SDU3-3]
MNDHSAYHRQAAEALLEGTEGEQRKAGEQALHALIDLWLDGAQADPADVVQIGIDDLASATQGQPPDQRVASIQQTLTRRQADKLVRQAVAMALPVARGEQPAQQALPEAERLAQQIDELLAEVRALPDASLRQRLLSDLASADLDCRYVISGGNGATSTRLARQLDS